MNKTERQFNLIALLLDTRRPLRAAEIRARFDDYKQQSDETFKRMFERDKSEIEDLGFTIDRDVLDAITDEIGYRIRPEKVLLRDPELAPDEMAALSLAAQAWESDGALGLLKLSVSAGVGEPGPAAFVMPRVENDANVRALVDAIMRRKVVTFTYRTGGGATAEVRTIEPHALHHRGAWYLSGYDRGRKDDRSFRLPRIEGEVTVAAGAHPDFEPRAKTRDAPGAPWEGEEASTRARVALAPDVAWWVARRTRAERVGERDDGWVVLDSMIADVPSFAGWLAGFGDAALALEPVELRAEVIARLRALSGALSPPATKAGATKDGDA